MSISKQNTRPKKKNKTQILALIFLMYAPGALSEAMSSSAPSVRSPEVMSSSLYSARSPEVSLQKIQGEPSFNCNEQLNYVENTICGDQYLSSLDQYMNTLYLSLQEITTSPTVLKKAQLEWLKSRNQCTDENCLTEKYNTRIDTLIGSLKNLDKKTELLHPNFIINLINEKLQSYAPIAIEKMDKFTLTGDVFPVTFLGIKDAEVVSFKRAGIDNYIVLYAYTAFAKNKIFALDGHLALDSKGNIISTHTDTNAKFIEYINDTVKFSKLDFNNDLNAIYGVANELGDNEKDIFPKSLLMLATSNPVHRLKGTGGALPCERHDGKYYLIEGSPFGDEIECSWGSELVIANSGNDIIDTGWDDDIVIGGEGDDLIDTSIGSAIVYPGEGNDEVTRSHSGRVMVLYGRNWGHDKLQISCDDLIVFSSDNRPENVIWDSSNNIIQKNGKGVIEFIGSSAKCVEVYFSKIPFH